MFSYKKDLKKIHKNNTKKKMSAQTLGRNMLSKLTREELGSKWLDKEIAFFRLPKDYKDDWGRRLPPIKKPVPFLGPTHPCPPVCSHRVGKYPHSYCYLHGETKCR